MLFSLCLPCTLFEFGRLLGAFGKHAEGQPALRVSMASRLAILVTLLSPVECMALLCLKVVDHYRWANGVHQDLTTRLQKMYGQHRPRVKLQGDCKDTASQHQHKL